MTELQTVAAPTNNTKGVLVSLAVIPVGVALWVVLWNFGFIASLVSFGIAYGALWLYTLVSSNQQPTRRDAFLLLGVILLGVVLSFLAGMISDAWSVYTEFVDGAQFFSADFWSFTMEGLSNPDVWSDYMVDMLISLVFAALGTGALIRGLFARPAPEVTPAEKQ